MRKHPLTELAARHSLFVDYEALGQHYGLQTDLLDLTSSVEVAAFFAVAGWSQESQWFAPMSSGHGVFYRVHWQNAPEHTKYFDCVGHGPGTRPAAQHAWAFRLRRGADFEAIPIVERIEFRHDSGASREVLGMFAGGKRIYPRECLVDLVQKLRKLPFVTMDAIRLAISKEIPDANSVPARAEKAAYALNSVLDVEVVDGYALELEPEDVAKGQRDAEALAENILTGVGVRLVRYPAGLG